MPVYEFDGEEYKRASKHQKEWGDSLISQLHLRGDEAVLDLGCGDGVLSAQIAQLVPHGRVVGIDASYGMLQTAKQLESDNLSFLRADINDIDFSDEFDVVFSNAALHWIPDHRLLLRHALDALKPGGSIHWNFAGDGTCAAFCSVMREKMTDGRYTLYFDGFSWPWFMPSKARYQKLLGCAGFSEFEIAEEHKDRHFSDADEMIRWIDQPCIVPFISRLPDKIKGSFRREVIQRMIQKTEQQDGTCFETFRRLNVTAVK